MTKPNFTLEELLLLCERAGVKPPLPTLYHNHAYLIAKWTVCVNRLHPKAKPQREADTKIIRFSHFLQRQQNAPVVKDYKTRAANDN